MALPKDQVKYVAKLANLPLTPEEEEKYSEQLSKILDYIEQLNKVDTQNIETTFNVSGQNTIEREDTATVCLSQDEALSNAPKKNDGMFFTSSQGSTLVKVEP